MIELTTKTRTADSRIGIHNEVTPVMSTSWRVGIPGERTPNRLSGLSKSVATPPTRGYPDRSVTGGRMSARDISEARGLLGRTGLAVFALGAILSACGGFAPTTPVSPAPTPLPTPPPFLPVGPATAVRTFRVDDSGRLEPTAVQELNGGWLTGEPRRRFVFTPGVSSERGLATIVSYAIDPRTGSLVERSRAQTDPLVPSPSNAGFVGLFASPTLVYGLWQGSTLAHVSGAYVAHAVSNEGRLADGYVERRSPFSTGEASLLADSAADLVYVGSSTGDGLIAYAVEGYGGLREVGFGTQCGSTRVVSVTPVAAVRGFVLASGWSWDAKSRV